MSKTKFLPWKNPSSEKVSRYHWIPPKGGRKGGGECVALGIATVGIGLEITLDST